MDKQIGYLQIGVIILVLLVGMGTGMWLQARRHKSEKRKRISIDGERKQKLETSFFSRIWENSQIGFLLSNERGEILAINPFLLEMAGISGEVKPQVAIDMLFQLQCFDDVFHSILLPGLRESEGKGISVDLQLNFDAAVKDVELSSNLVKGEASGEKSVFIIFRELSGTGNDQRLHEARQQAEEVRKLKTTFLSNMSHEIRTPLNGILGSTANIILHNSHNRELVEQLEIINLSGERLLSTINNILDMSRIIANKMELKLEKINVTDFLSLILMPYKSLAIKKGLLLTIKHQAQPLIAKIDKRYFELIVTNIVGNAIKYTEKGLIRVTLEPDSNYLRLCVSDDGIGISDEYINKLFNPFEQESFGYNREFEGSGIGLSITKNLIDLLSGEITITSKKGQGTIVSVVLPLIENDETISHKN